MLVWLQACIFAVLSAFPGVNAPGTAFTHGQRIEYTDRAYFNSGPNIMEFNFQTHSVLRTTTDWGEFFNNTWRSNCTKIVGADQWCESINTEGWDDAWRWQSKTYFWKGAYYVKATEDTNFFNSRSTITSGWKKMPTDVDALVDEDADYEWGFKGNLSWKYSIPGDFTVLEAVPMDVSFPGVPYSPDAGLRHYAVDYVLFFKGNMYWAFNQYTRAILPTFPRNVLGTPGKCEPYEDHSALAGVINDRLAGGATPNNYLSNSNCVWKVYAPKLYWNGISGELDELVQLIQSNASYAGISMMFTMFDLRSGDNISLWANRDKNASHTAYHDTTNRTLERTFSISSPPTLWTPIQIAGSDSKSFSIQFASNNDGITGAGFQIYYWMTNSQKEFTSLLGPMWLTSYFNVTNVSGVIRPATQTPAVLDLLIFMQMVIDVPLRRTEAFVNVYKGSTKQAQNLFAICNLINSTSYDCPTYDYVIGRCPCQVSGLPGGVAFIELVAPSDLFVSTAIKYSARSTCNGLQNITDKSGLISDGSGGLLYPSSQNCAWYITNNDTEALMVVLTLTSFQTQSDAQGNDPMKVYDRFNNTAPHLLQTISGFPAVPVVIESETAEMYITWTTDAPYSKTSSLQGWEGTYNTIYLPSPVVTAVTGYESLLEPNTTDLLNLAVGASLTFSIFPFDKFNRLVDSKYFGENRFAFFFRIVPDSVPAALLDPLLSIPRAINSSSTDPAYLALDPELRPFVYDYQLSGSGDQVIMAPTHPGDYFVYFVCRYRNSNTSLVFPAFNKTSRLRLSLIPSIGNSLQSSIGNPLHMVSEGTTLRTNAGANSSMIITVRDQYSNILNRGNSDVRVFAISSTYAIVVSLIDNGDGTYFASMYPTSSASYSMTVLVEGADIPNSPFKLYVLPGPTDPSKTEITIDSEADDGTMQQSTVVYDGKQGTDIASTFSRLSLPDKPFNITVAVFDSLGNPRNELNDLVSVSFGCGPNCGMVTAVELNQTNHSAPNPPSDLVQGFQGAKYLFVVVPSSRGPFDISVYVNEALALGSIPVSVGAEMAPVSWHTVLGVLATVINVVLCVTSWVLVTLRRHLPPLKPMSYNLLMLTTLGALVWIHFPLVEALGDSYPCGLAPWLALLAPVLWCTPLLLAILRLRIYFPFSKLKLRWARRELAFSELVEIQEQRRLFSETRFILFYLSGVLVTLFIIAPISVIFSDQASDSDGCGVGSALEGTWAALGSLYFILLLVALYEVRNCDETLGFRKEGGRLVIYAALLGLIAIVLRGSTNSAPRARNDAFFLIWLIPMIYQVRGVLLPALRTLSMFQKTVKQEVTVPLGELLLTSRGFKFFYHFTEAEFSQENPLCFQAIERYRRKTSLAALKDIYEKYFAPGAPLQVNIPFKVVEELRIFVKSANASTPMEQLQCAFDVAQTELLTLMSGDSYRRFLSSSHYEAFQKGAPEPNIDGTYMSQNSSGSSTNNEHRRGDKGGVEMSNMDEDHGTRESAPHGDGGDPILTGGGDALPIIEEKVQLQPTAGSGSLQSSSTATFEPHEMHEAIESYVV